MSESRSSEPVNTLPSLVSKRSTGRTDSSAVIFKDECGSRSTNDTSSDPCPIVRVATTHKFVTPSTAPMSTCAPCRRESPITSNSDTDETIVFVAPELVTDSASLPSSRPASRHGEAADSLNQSNSAPHKQGSASIFPSPGNNGVVQLYTPCAR